MESIGVRTVVAVFLHRPDAAFAVGEAVAGKVTIFADGTNESSRNNLWAGKPYLIC